MRRWLAVLCLLVTAGGCSSEPEGSPDRPATSVDAPSPTPSVQATPGATPFDEEAWRRQTVELYGPEPEYSDGSKLDYVRAARQLCATRDRPVYEEGSLQDHMEETYCPNAPEG